MLLELTLLVASFLLFWKWYQRASKLNHFPGFGPLTSLPIVGHAYKLGLQPVEKLEEYRQRFGDVFRFDLGSLPTVIISDYEEAVEIMRSESLNVRGDNMKIFNQIRGLDDRGQEGGIFMTHGQQWRDLRRFALQQINDLAVGKKDILADIVNQEVNRFCDRLESEVKASSEVKISKKFMPSINNVIWRILTGKDTDIDDPEVRNLSKAVADVFASFDPTSLTTVAQMQSEWCYLLLKNLGLKTVVDYCTPILNLLKNELKKYQPESQGNFIERHLAQLEKHKDDKDSVFYGQRGQVHLLGTVFDLFNGGTETSSTTLEWLLLFMAEYPQVQEKVYQEIQNEIGSLRSPNLHDKSNTPYTLAAMEEVMRLCPMAFISFTRMAVQDVNIKGRLYPKGTQVYVNIRPIHRNAKYFSNPQTFNPNRFLNEGRFESDKHMMFFGNGKRKCPGEILAKAEVYIFFTSILQKFQLIKIQGQPSVNDYLPGLVNIPKPFKLMVKLRQT